MKINVEELKPKKAVLKIEDTKPYFVNSIRRVMLSELPKLTVNEVVIYDNTSPLFDEIISHRIGMVPIPTDLSLLSFRDECVCKGKGCPNCTVRYTLSKEGEGVVYSGDLQPEETSWAITEDKITIVELYNDQRLILDVPVSHILFKTCQSERARRFNNRTGIIIDILDCGTDLIGRDQYHFIYYFSGYTKCLLADLADGDSVGKDANLT